MRPRSVRIFLLAFSLLPTWVGCTTKLSRFDIINLKGGSQEHQITRSETADQGSGQVSSVIGPGGHTLTRVTVGGFYLRRSDVGNSSRNVAAGLHGNPRANQ